MAESFDAYHEWLGIAPEEQPPHLYRLLAVGLYEDKASVIESAVDRQMAHLRTFQTGPRAKLCQELLNRLSAARVTLLDPEKKAAYDAQLKEQLAAKSAKSKRRVARALPLEEPLATATPLQESSPAMGTPLETAVSGPQVRSDSSRHRGHRKKGPPWVVIGIGGALLAIVAVVAMMAMSGGDEPIAQRPKKRTPKKTVDQSVKSSESDTVVGDEPNVSKTSVEAPKKKPALPAKVPDYLAPTDVAKRKEKAVNPFAVAPVDEQPPAKFDPTPERNQPPKTVEPPPKADPAPVATTPALAKVPTDDVLKKADVEIREVFDFKAATDLESRKKLVAEIRSTALETKTDPVGQYAMLRTARDMSAHLGDYAAAEETINEMSERFDIDPLAMRSKAIVRAMTAKVSSEQRGKVARAGLALAKEFHKADRYKEAATIITAIGRAASRVKDKQLVADARQLALESRAMAKQYVSVRRAFETLETTPDDPAANTSVGRYLCFAKGEWKRGLAMLAKGDDARLKELATKELAGVEDAKGQAALADTWWKIGKEKSNQSYSELLPHAVSWYRKALPQLTGLGKAKVEKRLEAIRAEANAAQGKRLVLENVAIGATVTASRFIKQEVPFRAIDGILNTDKTGYWNPGGKPPAWIRVQLRESREIHAVRLLVPIGVLRWPHGHGPLDYAILVNKNGKEVQVVNVKGGRIKNGSAVRNAKDPRTMFVTLKLRRPVRTKSVTLLVTRTSGDNPGPVIFEMEVYAAKRTSEPEKKVKTNELVNILTQGRWKISWRSPPVTYRGMVFGNDGTWSMTGSGSVVRGTWRQDGESVLVSHLKEKKLEVLTLTSGRIIAEHYFQPPKERRNIGVVTRE